MDDRNEEYQDMSDFPEPQFIVRTELIIPNPSRPEVISFRIYSKVQRSPNPQRWYTSVEEELEPQEICSPLFVLHADGAEDLARNLLEIAGESRDFYDSS